MRNSAEAAGQIRVSKQLQQRAAQNSPANALDQHQRENASGMVTSSQFLHISLAGPCCMPHTLPAPPQPSRRPSTSSEQPYSAMTQQ